MFYDFRNQKSILDKNNLTIIIFFSIFVASQLLNFKLKVSKKPFLFCCFYGQQIQLQFKTFIIQLSPPVKLTTSTP